MYYSRKARRAHQHRMDSMRKAEILFTLLILLPLSLYGYIRIWMYLFSL